MASQMTRMTKPATAAQIAESRVQIEGELTRSQLPIVTTRVSGSAVSPLLSIAQAVSVPLTVAIISMLVGFWDRDSPAEAYTVLAAFSAALSALVFGNSTNWACSTRQPIRRVISISWKWGVVGSCLLVLGYLTHTHHFFSPAVLATWLLVTPAVLMVIDVAASYSLVYAHKHGQPMRKCAIVGANGIGVAVQRRIEAEPLLRMQVEGFFDDRSSLRLPVEAREKYLGPLRQLPRYVNEHAVSDIYICLPVVWHKRISDLLTGLEDTTASVHFVPDIYMHELLHTRVDLSLGIPTLAIIDSPFHGMPALIKRLVDLVISVPALVLLSPVMFLCTVGVRLSSPGPVLFTQQRNGMGGERISVLKFRTMYVHDDNGDVTQATSGDPRITKFGRFLRKTSLDELPQLINVVRGDMSVVGPRPHAVQHNEMYRKVISKYMVRHKVKPGITGLAQIRGFRGETKTLDKMVARVESDLDYIRSWSLGLDLWIILKTLKVVLSDPNAL